MRKMTWKNTKTGETGSWPYTGQDAEGMINEARCYSAHIPEMEYTLVETKPPVEAEDEVFVGRM